MDKKINKKNHWMLVTMMLPGLILHRIKSTDGWLRGLGNVSINLCFAGKLIAQQIFEGSEE